MAASHPYRRLIALGLAQAGIYAAVAALSSQFDPAIPDVDRPILTVVALFAGAFVLYLCSLRLALDRNEAAADAARRTLLGPILGLALVYRLILWWSQPILETDFYRYLWDGRVLAAGISPYKYSPDTAARWAGHPQAPPDLRQLEDLRRSPAIATVFERIGFPEVPTVYPPAAQLVFAVAAWITPPDASIVTQARVLKGLLLLFDLGSIWLLLSLLRRTQRPSGWVLAYAWCPLVLKEFSNTGRPDSLAVFFLLLAVLWDGLPRPSIPSRGLPRPSRSNHGRFTPSAPDHGLPTPSTPETPRVAGKDAIPWDGLPRPSIPNRSLPRPSIPKDGRGRPSHESPSRQMLWASLAAAAWGMATLAKLYPLVLLPLLARWWQRRLGLGCLAPLASFAVVLAAAAFPFWRPVPMPAPVPALDRAVVRLAETTEPEVHGLTTGIRTFLSQWEMNDWLFAVVHENLRTPVEDSAIGPPAWFAVTPTNWRAAATAFVAEWLGARGWQNGFEPAFLLACALMYSLTAALLLGIALWPWPNDPRAETETLLRRLFWSLAWFWLLSPTQNPWYWIWPLAFVPFAGRGWLIAAGCVLVYYLRFWFDAHFPDGTVVWPTRYSGWQFFDFVIVWIEHLPILLAVGWTAWQTAASFSPRRRGGG